MANTSSAKKALRVSARNRARNIKIKATYRAARKEVVDSIKKGDVKAAKAALPKAYAQIDMAAKKKVIHVNTASRYKSRMASAIAKIEKTAK